MREGVTMVFGEGKDRGTPSQNQAKPVGAPPHQVLIAALHILFIHSQDLKGDFRLFRMRTKGLPQTSS